MSRMPYLDFDVQIQRVGDGYRAQVLTSPAGQASRDFGLPFAPLEIENFLLRVSRTRRAARRIDSPEMEAAKIFGGRLFDAVFGGEVRSALRSSLTEANRQDAGLRIRLRLAETPELTDLPWEYLYDPVRHRFLVLSVETPLVRYLDLPERIRPLGVAPPINVLVMISSPHDYPRLNVEREWMRLGKALEDLERQGLLRLERLEEATLMALQRRLRRGPCHIFHFIGHGGFDQQAEDGILILEDGNGRSRSVSGHYLGLLLHDHRVLRLAVLNACEGARTSRTDPFAGTAQSLAREGIPAVIAMQFEITDEAAITFAHEFYQAVADGYPVDAALAEARKAIYAQGNDVEWGTPVLYLRSPDGQIFIVAPPSSAVGYQEGERERRQGHVMTLLAEAQAAIAVEDWSVAIEKLQAILALEPTHPAATAQLPEVRQALDLHTLYVTGEWHYGAGRWREALDCFRQVQARQNDYKQVSALMMAAEGQLAMEPSVPPSEPRAEIAMEASRITEWRRRRLFWIASGLVVLLVLGGLFILITRPNGQTAFIHGGDSYEVSPKDPEQQYELGKQYLYGTGVDRDYTEALKWFRKAAAQGHVPAQTNLAVMYANGQGVDQDDAQAVQWYRRAALQGDADARKALQSRGLSW